MNANSPRWLRMLLSDRKKLGIMVVLLCVGLLLWGRLLLKRVPQTAVADPNLVAQINDERGITDDEDEDDSVDPDTFRRRVVIVDIPAFVMRDIFAPAGRFRPDTQKPQNDASHEKSHGDRTDSKQQRRMAALTAATALTLQTTVEGDKPLALIDGKLVAPGEIINGFTLIRVGGRWVLLEMNGIYVRLEM